MGEKRMESSFSNGKSESNGDHKVRHNGKVSENRHSSSKHKHREKERARKETEEERRIRKMKEASDKEKTKKDGKRRLETEEERRIRKDRERKEREERHKREGRRLETEDERRVRKDREKKEREERHKREGRRMETEDERRIRREREKRESKKESEGSSEKVQVFKQEEQENRKDEHFKQHKIKKEENVEEEETEEEEAEETEEDEDDGEKDVDMTEESIKMEPDESEDDDEPLSFKKTKNTSMKTKRRSRGSDSEDDAPLSSSKKAKRIKIENEEKDKKFKTNKKSHNHSSASSSISPSKGKHRRSGDLKAGDDDNVWKWWEEERKDDGTKWKFLEHRGPLFAPDYVPLPPGVHFYYDGQKMKLSLLTEEVGGFYARMIDHDYTTKEVFNKNFFTDWRKCMTDSEKKIITHLNKCDFTEIDLYYKKMSEERKNRSKEEKKEEKEKNAAITDEYGHCTIDSHKEKIGNFRIEPPGLFRGRGEHPKQGMLKHRVQPEDVIINCSKNSSVPTPPKGHSWKEVRHDNTVTWLASWTENVQNQIKYVMLNPSSKLKGEKDMMKYEKARELKQKIAKIREDYTADFKSKEMRVRQRSVALYFIDKLALRAGNEKDEDQADTVGCCSLRVEHIQCYPEYEGKEFMIEFDFLGKDSIRYNNIVQVEKRVFKNVQLFMDNKKGSDDLFDRLNTSILNEYLNTLMKGLTAKVFRTYNASFTLQEQLNELTEDNDNIPNKILSYNRANRKVAILCNHQRAAPKTHDQSMNNLRAKIDAKKDGVEKAEKEYKIAKKAYKSGGSATEKVTMEKKKKAVERGIEALEKLETQAVDKEENKTIALGTSKLNYLDPRISVAWCKKFGVPIEKVYNKTQRDKFRWAIDMAGPDYVF